LPAYFCAVCHGASSPWGLQPAQDGAAVIRTDVDIEADGHKVVRLSAEVGVGLTDTPDLTKPIFNYHWDLGAKFLNLIGWSTGGSGEFGDAMNTWGNTELTNINRADDAFNAGGD
jgi:hypothetical protein